MNWTINEKIYIPGEEKKDAPKLRSAESLGETNRADHYRTTHKEDFQPLERTCWISIEVLSELTGKPWNNAALCLVQGLRPSSVRVTTGYCTSDAVIWRVTVVLEKDNKTIKSIEQEVQAGATDDCQHGHHLTCFINSDKNG